MSDDQENNVKTRSQFLSNMNKLQDHLDRMKLSHNALRKYESGAELISREAFGRVEDNIFIAKQAQYCVENLASDLLNSSCDEDPEMVDAHRERLKQKTEVARYLGAEASRMFEIISKWRKGIER